MCQLLSHFKAKFLVITLLFCFGTELMGQYTVQVTNSKTGQPIENVEITVTSNNSKIGNTDENGLININEIKGTKIELYRDGFERITLVLGLENKIFVSLNPQVESVEEVVIVGYNSQKRRED